MLLKVLGRIEKELKKANYIFDASSIFEAISQNKIEVLIGNYTMELTRYELINVLWKNFLLKRNIIKEECLRITEIIKNILKLMHILNIDCNEKEVFDVASQLEITIYDASYIYNAKRLNLSFITEDQKLKRKVENYIKVYSIKEIIK